jgi:hypothetical protein
MIGVIVTILLVPVALGLRMLIQELIGGVWQSLTWRWREDRYYRREAKEYWRERDN